MKVSIAPKRRIDLDAAKESDTDNADEKIIQLIERGDTIAAVIQVRQTYNMGLTEAKTFVDQMQSDLVESSG